MQITCTVRTGREGAASNKILFCVVVPNQIADSSAELEHVRSIYTSRCHFGFYLYLNILILRC